MTELQMGLIGLGAAAVIGVLAYNKWQEYRHRKLAEKLLNVRHSDVLLDEPGEHAAHEPAAPARDEPVSSERIEPIWRPDPDQPFDLPSADGQEAATGSEEEVSPIEALPEPAPATLAESRPRTAAATVDAVATGTAVDNAPEPVAPPLADARATHSVAEPIHLLSPMIDYVASFEAVEPAPAYQLMETQRNLQSRVRKPVFWVGYNEYSREWEYISEGGHGEYRRLRVGLQLVDRQGAVSDSDLSIFHIAMQDLADELMAIAELPPRQPMLDAASQLDAFCAGVDIQIGINVISQGQVFQGTKLRALAEAAGLSIDAGGRFVRHDELGNVLFLLLNQETPGFAADSMRTMTTHGLTFLLDVPRVAHGDRVFNQMVDLARRFADVLHGSLVDDNRRPLSESALEPIRQQIIQFQSAMAAQNLPAGSALTQRLFS